MDEKETPDKVETTVNESLPQSAQIPENVEQTSQDTPPAETSDFYKDIEAEYSEKGTISEEFKESLKTKGLKEDVLNGIVSGLEAKTKIDKIESEKILDDIYNSVGGREKAENIKNWASTNLSKEEIDGINSIKSIAVMKLVYGALKTKMEAADGKLPEYIEGGGKDISTGYFKSKSEMVEAIKDPKYAKDPEYRDKVTAKIRAARAQGINLDY